MADGRSHRKPCRFVIRRLDGLLRLCHAELAVRAQQAAPSLYVLWRHLAPTARAVLAKSLEHNLVEGLASLARQAACKPGGLCVSDMDPIRHASSPAANRWSHARSLRPMAVMDLGKSLADIAVGDVLGDRPGIAFGRRAVAAGARQPVAHDVALLDL